MTPSFSLWFIASANHLPDESIIVGWYRTTCSIFSRLSPICFVLFFSGRRWPPPPLCQSLFSDPSGWLPQLRSWGRLWILPVQDSCGCGSSPASFTGFGSNFFTHLCTPCSRPGPSVQLLCHGNTIFGNHRRTIGLSMITFLPWVPV